jgi:hypothetical protein
MKIYGGVDVWIHVFLTSRVDRSEWSASRPDRVNPGERAPDAHWTGGWMGSQTGLDYVRRKKYCPYRNSAIQPTAASHSQSLYRLRYLGSVSDEIEPKIRPWPLPSTSVRIHGSLSSSHSTLISYWDAHV